MQSFYAESCSSTKLWDYFRSILSLCIKLSWLQVALASGEGKFIETVRSSQLAINLPNVKCIDAQGLALQRDNLHLTTMSQVQVGLKLASAFIDSFGNMPWMNRNYRVKMLCSPCGQQLNPQTPTSYIHWSSFIISPHNY